MVHKPQAVQLLNGQWTSCIVLTFVCPTLYIFNQIASYLYTICTLEAVLLIHELLTLYVCLTILLEPPWQ